MIGMSDDPLRGPLSEGSIGHQVSRVQARLNELQTSERAIIVDGRFGLRTGQRVRMFQTVSQLRADGIVGPMTSSALGFASYAALPPPVALPQPHRSAPSGSHQIPTSDGPDHAPISVGPFESVIAALINALNSIRAGIARRFARMTEVSSGVARAVSGAIGEAVAAIRPATRFAIDQFELAISMVRSAMLTMAGRIGPMILAAINFVSASGLMQFLSTGIAQLVAAVGRAVQQIIEWAAEAFRVTVVIGAIGAVVANFIGTLEEIVLE